MTELRALVRDLRTKAFMLRMGEAIALHSECDAMEAAADELERQAAAVVATLPARGLAQAAPDMLEALTALLKDPTGCAFCDSGKPRKSVRTGELCEHDEACGYVLARAAIAKATGSAT
jgi:hypothetical protein